MIYLATLIQKVREHGKWPDMPKWLDETDLHQKCKIRGDFIYEGIPVCLGGRFTKKEWIVQHLKWKAQEWKFVSLKYDLFSLPDIINEDKTANA